MSREIIGHGNPFVVEYVDLGFGGTRTEALRVDNETGDVYIHGVKVNGGAAVLSLTKRLTSTEILDLASTPIEVIGNPGAGKYIEVVSMHAFLNYGGTAYATVAATDYLRLCYTNGSGAKLIQDVDPTGFADATADAHLLIGPAVSFAPASAKVVASLAGAWTTGNSPITLEVLFRVRDL